MGCNGVVSSVDELEKEWQERLDEYVGQRANFPQICGETEVSQMFNEDRVSSSSCMEDTSFIFCDDLGSAKTCIKFV